ncbi:hypothetical protein [Amycolatopsis sp. DG1A-15b]|uniref:hypothetical protein n=1 Tax=Amycolatopsis sp. DG1A-15b TaxID=3052846 RepID=UPI00255C0162|nr:hypothetical protein [Amycolatopsis sp. DG1A-15b]WIX92548.1 hypothetical protein QRY02_19750 [Amycolatopsis sp. DG1A-15b]
MVTGVPAVVRGERVGHGALVDPRAASGPGVRLLRVDARGLLGDGAARGTRALVGVLVEPFESCTDVRVRSKSSVGFLGVRPRVGGRLVAGQLGEAGSLGVRCPFIRGVEDLLHLGLRAKVWLLVPGRDRTRADSELLGEFLIAQPQRGLERRS